jgi:hypothetical protein
MAEPTFILNEHSLKNKVIFLKKLSNIIYSIAFLKFSIYEHELKRIGDDMIIKNKSERYKSTQVDRKFLYIFSFRSVFIFWISNRSDLLILIILIINKRRRPAS